MFETTNSRPGRFCSGVFSEVFVYLRLEAAVLCIEKEVALMRIDYVPIEPYGHNQFPVHRKLLGNNSLVLERIDLSEVPPGHYALIGLPLTTKGREPWPLRAILLG